MGKSSTFLSFALLSLSLAACAPVGNESVKIDKPSGKTDALDSLCELVGLAPSCDICADQGWLGDGACDDFCQTPDPDCQSPLPPDFDPQNATCDFHSEVFPGVDSSASLEETFTFATQDINPSNLARLDSLRLEQLLAAARYSIDQPSLPTQDLFLQSDDGDFEMLTGTPGGRPIVWFRWYAGDTEVGAIFEDASLDMIGEVSDGDILSCVTPQLKTPPTQPAGDGCQPGGILDVASSRELEPFAASTLTLKAPAHFSTLQAEQVFEAIRVTGMDFGGPPANLAEALALFDDREVLFIELQKPGNPPFTWVRFWAGDTEVGAIFQSGTTISKAEVNDQQVFGC